MQLQLKNIGMIKEANVKIDGLTVIAGENDTGKSTVGKIIYGCIKSLNDKRRTNKPEDDTRKVCFNIYIRKLFNNQISEDGNIILSYDNESLSVAIKKNSCFSYNSTEQSQEFPLINSPLFIETPMVWNIFPLLKTVRGIALDSFLNDIDFQIPPTFEDLYFALTIKMKERSRTPLDIKTIIGGEFKETGLNDYKFYKDGDPIELINTATGIKQFGILQVLNDNNHLQDGQILIFDEPEVHLHPKWQLEMAKIIVELLKNGVKILVNSHSPYMIEALERYAKKEEVPADFYLAEDGYIKKENNNNSETLSKIFEKLSEPFDTFDKMDSDSMENLING